MKHTYSLPCLLPRAVALCLLFAAALTGCTDNDDALGAANAPLIQFTPVVNAPHEQPPVAGGTRAATGHPIESGNNIPTGKSFGVYAYSRLTAAGDIDPYTSLQNAEVTSTGTGFSYSPVAKWPTSATAQLAFYGYYPWQNQATPPPVGDPVIDVAMGGTNAARMTIDYTTPAAPNKQVDLMYAYAPLATGFAPVTMNFGHALARIKFEAKAENFTQPVQLTGITIKDVQTKGTLAVINAATPLWSALSNPTDMTLTTANGLRPNYNLGTTLTSVTGTGGDMLLIPQSVQTLEMEVEGTLNGTAFAAPFVYSLAGTANWEMNKITTYQITISPDGITLVAKVDNWTDNSASIIEDAQWWLTVDKDEVDAPSLTPSTGTLEFKTNYNLTTQGFPAGLQIEAIADPSKIEYIPPVAPADRWLTLVNNVGGDGDLLRQVNVAVSAAPSNKARVAKFSIKAGNLTKIITVNQGDLYIGRFGGKLGETSLGSGIYRFERELYAQTKNEGGPNAYMQWKTTDTATPGNPTSPEDGKANTLALRDSEHPAGYACIRKNNNPGSITSVTDPNYVWYLPAQNQLMAAYVVKNSFENIFPFSSHLYWSSTEAYGTNAWFVGFYDGYVYNYNNKTVTLPVRCVREN